MNHYIKYISTVIFLEKKDSQGRNVKGYPTREKLTFFFEYFEFVVETETSVRNKNSANRLIALFWSSLHFFLTNNLFNLFVLEPVLLHPIH